MPKVSVVIPSYNHAAYVAHAVQSVLSQSEPDLELIVVDDGSTDDSLKVLAGFDDPRMCVVPQQNGGAHAAINRGLSQASGRYLTVLNSDDAFEPHRLAKMTGVLERRPDVALAGSYIEVIDDHGRALGVKHGYQDLEPWPLELPEHSFRAGADLRAALLTENFLATTSNFCFTREWWQRIGPFRALRYAHDWDFALRAARAGELALLPEPLLRYRVHPGNTIRENQAAMILEICWCLAVHLPQQRLSAGDGSLPPEWIDRLLNSIYTYGCDRVLAVMLLQRLADHPERADQLLDPADPARAGYLAYIERCAGKRQGAGQQAAPAHVIGQVWRAVTARMPARAHQIAQTIRSRR